MVQKSASGHVGVSELSRRVKTDEGETVRFAGYRIRQSLTVRSARVESLPALASASAALLEQGVSLASDDLDFIYTKANDAKIEMMADATKDARARAEQIAANGGRRIKELRNARMGVVQINPLYSTHAINATILTTPWIEPEDIVPLLRQISEEMAKLTQLLTEPPSRSISVRVIRSTSKAARYCRFSNAESFVKWAERIGFEIPKTKLVKQQRGAFLERKL